MFRSVGLVCLLFGVAAYATEVPQMPKARPVTTTTTIVNCNNGQSVQAAVDASSAPAEIQITGICVENVLIRNKDISLRGTQKASLDGIRGANSSMPALTVQGPVIATINDLSFSNSAGNGLAIRGGASITVNRGLFENNGAVGLRVDSGAFVIANDSTFTANPATNTSTSDAQFFCIACDFTGGGPAAVSTRGAIVSLLDSAVTGTLGIIADQVGAFVDVDCISVDTPHPCSLNVTGPAAVGTFSGTAALTGAGDFTGQLIADDRGTVKLTGAVQRTSSSDGAPNIVDNLGEIIVAPLLDVTPAAPSLLRDTQAAHFGRVLLLTGSTLKGTIQCTGAADAFLDPTVARQPGAIVTGCEHGTTR